MSHPATPVRVLIPAALQAVEPVLGRVVLELNGTTMGTTWSVKVATHPAYDLHRLRQSIERTLDTVVMQMSTWESDSDLSRFNLAAAGQWVALPSLCFDVVNTALNLARLSNGAFDPSAGPLVNLWGFGPDGGYRQPGWSSPDSTSIDHVRQQCGWQRIDIDVNARKIYQPGGAYLDLSGIAKGFGVDHVAAGLQAAGIENFLVEIGGELRGEGVKPNATPWWVALEQPKNVQLPVSAFVRTPVGRNAGTTADVPAVAAAPGETRIALHGLSVATSGNYRRNFNDRHTVRSHTIDPRDGYPIENDLASVTVVHAECMMADALSTALSVLGVEHGLAFANQHQVAATFLAAGIDRWNEHSSDAWLEMLE